MQRKFLEDLKIDNEVIDKILAEVEKTKQGLTAERDNYKEQLETAQNTLKEFDGVNIKEMQDKIKTLTSDLETKQVEFQNKIADMEFNTILDTAITKSGARNAKALKALLDIDNLKSSKNQSYDITTAIEKVKAENDYLFVSDEPFKNAVRSTNTQTNGKKLSLVDAMKYANSHPDVDIKNLI